MAKIEIRTRDLDKTSWLPDQGTPQHTFLIYTNDAGEKVVLRGGSLEAKYNNQLNTDNITDSDLVVVLDNYNSNSIDWDDGSIPIHQETIASGTDFEISQIWLAMRAEGQRINNEGYDYEYFTQNCNTVMSNIVKAAGLEVILPQMA